MQVDGSVNVVEAIQRSCDVFFYQLVLKLGLEKLHEYAERFGFGQLTNFDIGEETGLIYPPNITIACMEKENGRRDIS